MIDRLFKMTLALGLAVTAAAGAAQGTLAAPAETIHIGNFMFDRMSVTVRPGTTVTWINDDDIPHTVVAKDLAFRSKVLDTGDRFSLTFAKPGQFVYFCSLHPRMTGTIVVKG
ncbi:MAG TPA: cupredoxin family copper-binding protein [Croceibacterium sp.]|jgi:plastocyanin